MRTGNFRHREITVRRGLFRRREEVTILEVEHKGPIDVIMTHGTWWEAATFAEASEFTDRCRKRQVDLEIAEDELRRLRNRLGAVHDAVHEATTSLVQRVAGL